MPDATVSFAKSLLNTSGVIQQVVMAPYSLIVGRPDGMTVISAVRLYCQRKTGSTSFLNNAGAGKAWTQFFDASGNALAVKADLVVAADGYAWITTPAGAYRLEITAQADGSAMYPATCVLQTSSLSIREFAEAWSLDALALQYDPNYPNSRTGYLPATTFMSADNGKSVSTTLRPMQGSHFTPGTVTIQSYRDGYGYVKSAWCDLHRADGTLESSTNIPNPTSMNSTRDTTVTVPAGITKIVLRGVLNHGGSGSSSDGDLRFGFPTSSTNYGSAIASLTLAQAAEDLLIAPGFSRRPPLNGYRTFVSSQDNSAGYVETDKLTGAAGATFFVKIELNAVEPNTTELNNLFAVANPYKNAVLFADLSRRISQNIVSAIDTSRQTSAGAPTAIDLERKVAANVRLDADTSRLMGLLAVTKPDTVRKTGLTEHLDADSLRKTSRITSSAYDSRRSVHSELPISFDACRRTSLPQNVPFDSLRLVRPVGERVDAFFDTRRETAAGNILLVDTKRRFIVSHETKQFDTHRELTEGEVLQIVIEPRQYFLVADFFGL